MNFLRALTGTLIAIATTAASAQADLLISCADAPSEAVLQLPAPLKDWGQVYCTKFGHTLAAKERWVWSFPGAFAPVHLPAQMVRGQPKEVRHAAYFRRIELAQLQGAEAGSVSELINAKLGTKPDSPVSSAYRLTLTNQDGNSHTVLFAVTLNEVASGKGHWGIWCNKECKDGSPFMLLNFEKQAR